MIIEKNLSVVTTIAQKALDRNQRDPIISNLVDVLHNHEHLTTAWEELTQAVNLLNRYISGEEIQNYHPPVDLNYADDMKKALKKHGIDQLPTPDELQSEGENSQEFLGELVHVFRKTEHYQFLTEYKKSQAFFGEAMAVYGKLLIRHCNLEGENVFGASTLEEIFAVMRFNGIETRCYEVSKKWFADEETGTPDVDGRGFSHSLVRKALET